MENKQYLIVITLIDGQNFTVPTGAPDKIEATVFAEARFGNASVLRSDPVDLNNANPEFGCELAWKISDRKILHQLRVERKAIKLQVFMQTRKKTAKVSETTHSNATTNGAHETHQIELIGYTILDIRSADQTGNPKYKWCALLNPKFKKPSYNRPEIQLALTLSRLDDDMPTSHEDSSNQFSSISSLPEGGEQTNESLEIVSNLEDGRSHEQRPSANNHPDISNESNRLYRTCLDVTTSSTRDDEIIDNDIIIIRRNEVFYVYDNKKHKSSLEECHEHFKLTIKIPFTSNLDLLVDTVKQANQYMFSINFFGTSFHTEPFRELTSVKSRQISIDIRTSNPATLATYFELNPDLDIKLLKLPDVILGITTIQLNQLSGLDMKFRCSVEGIFNIQCENQFETPSLNPNIGVSVRMDKVEPYKDGEAPLCLNESAEASSGIRSFQFDTSQSTANSINHTHQLTMGRDDDEDEGGNVAGYDKDENDDRGLFEVLPPSQHNLQDHDEILIEDYETPGQDDHHFCFTIDLMKYSYTSSKVFSRELIIRYSYPFFGYKDTITTEQSIPISKTSSIVVSGFCEFNFATNARELSVALRQLPLNLEILAGDDAERQVVATCRINMAKLLGISGDTVDCSESPLHSTSSVPIYALNGEEIGELQIFLSVKDLGLPMRKRDSFHVEANGNLLASGPVDAGPSVVLNNFIDETRKNFESWRDESFERLSDEIRRRDDERFRRLYQRLEAKETSRNQEFERRLSDLDNLKQEFHSVLSSVKNLEQMLAISLQHLKEKHASLDERLDRIETRLSQVSEATTTSSREDRVQFNQACASEKVRTITGGALKNVEISPRRSSLRNGLPISGVPAAVRSTSLVRRPSEGATVSGNSRIVRRTTAQLPVSGGLGTRARSIKSNLSEEIQNLRRERAELLKRGCKPNDDLILEINSLIEKLAC